MPLSTVPSAQNFVFKINNSLLNIPKLKQNWSFTVQSDTANMVFKLKLLTRCSQNSYIFSTVHFFGQDNQIFPWCLCIWPLWYGGARFMNGSLSILFENLLEKKATWPDHECLVCVLKKKWEHFVESKFNAITFLHWKLLLQEFGLQPMVVHERIF